MPERLSIIWPSGSCARTRASSAAMRAAIGNATTARAFATCHHSSPAMLSVYSSDRATAAAGAGARRRRRTAQSRFMVEAANALAARGIAVATFDFPYMAQGRSVPDKPPVLEAHWREVIDEAARADPSFAGAAALHRRQVHGRPDRVAGRRAARRRHHRAGLSRLSAASAGQARAAPRSASAGHQGADALRPGHARPVRHRRRDPGAAAAPQSTRHACSRSRTATTRSRSA